VELQELGEEVLSVDYHVLVVEGVEMERLPRLLDYGLAQHLTIRTPCGYDGVIADITCWGLKYAQVLHYD
jgi:hypothetical protein